MKREIAQRLFAFIVLVLAYLITRALGLNIGNLPLWVKVAYVAGIGFLAAYSSVRLFPSTNPD